MLVIGKVLAIEPHPDPKVTKMKVTFVFIGFDKPILQIVTAADNVEAGQKVVVAMIGHEFPDFRIDQRKLRGVDSYGMFCGETDLGLPETTHGIYVAEPNAVVGSEYLAYRRL